MITSIFSKSKPINFLIVLFMLLIAFVIIQYKYGNDTFSTTYLFKKGMLFFALFITVLLLNFVVTKNNLTKKNNYTILLFSLFVVIIPQTMLFSSVIISNVFVLLALRRLISIRSQIEVKKKLFDAAFWISIAALFYFWAILFILLIFITLILYTDNRIKNWIVPFVGIATVLIFTIVYSILKHSIFMDQLSAMSKINFEFSAYNSIQHIIAITLLLSFGLWGSIFYSLELKKKMKFVKPAFKTILAALAITFAIIIVAPNKNGSEFIFLFSPLAIVLTNYIETIKERWFKEVFLALLIMAPITILVL